MHLTKYIFPSTVLLLVFLVLISTTDHNYVVGEDIDFMNGVSFVAPPRELHGNPFMPVKTINADWVAIMPFAFTPENTPEVIFDRQRQWWGEKTIGIIKTIEYAKQHKLKILLKPHVWVRGQGWTGEFKLENEEEWLIWEKSYEKYILNYAAIADSLDVDAFCIGLEFKHAVQERPEFWRNLINKARESYQGRITYAANWDNFENIPFWDEIDFIGINAYFPLSQKDTPEVRELLTAWIDKKQSLLELSKRYKKPIVFTEFGYRSIDKAAGNQWELQHHRRFNGQPNFEVQERAYAALFSTFWNEPWFKGGFLWKWYPDQQRNLDGQNSDYTPQKKPAEKIIIEWYKKH